MYYTLFCHKGVSIKKIHLLDEAKVHGGVLLYIMFLVRKEDFPPKLNDKWSITIRNMTFK